MLLVLPSVFDLDTQTRGLGCVLMRSNAVKYNK